MKGDVTARHSQLNKPELAAQRAANAARAKRQKDLHMTTEQRSARPLRQHTEHTAQPEYGKAQWQE